MKILVTSFREKLECYRRYIDQHEGYICEESFEMRIFADWDSVIEYVATRLAEFPQTDFAHIIIDDWDALQPVDLGYHNGAGVEIIESDDCDVDTRRLHASAQARIATRRDELIAAAQEKEKRAAQAVATRRAEIERAERLAKLNQLKREFGEI